MGKFHAWIPSYGHSVFRARLFDGVTHNRSLGCATARRTTVAQNEVGRVKIDLVRRLGDANATYASAKERAEQYQAVIVPKAEKSYKLSLKAYQGGEFEYLRVLQSQRVIAEARLEAVRSRGEAWRAFSEISGLILQDIEQTPSSPQP
jgi:outer membrane protein, heavy metal efflux system